MTLTSAQQQWVAETLAVPWRQLTQQLTAVVAVCDQLVADHAGHAAHFMPGDAALFQAVAALSAAISGQAATLADLTPATIASGKAGLCRLQLANGHDVYSLQLAWELLSATPQIQDLLTHFTAPVFVGATLVVARRFDYLRQQLGLPADTATLRLRSPFHYRQQAQVFVDPDAPDPAADEAAYYDYLAQAIATLAQGPQQTLVLFTSLKAIAAVHQRLAQTPLAAQKELLAQGVTGSAEKIAKRFVLGDNSVLLGAASFFEGIDYPDKLLELVILTRLPFDSPSDPVVKARAAALKQAGQDPFTADALPKATIRLRQSFGRLIRTEHDRGAFVVLDPRFATTRYGRQLQHALPNLKPMALPVQTIAQYVHAWLRHRPILSKEEEHA
jgi:ATP-dependent DNA helicase DinG